MNNPRTSQGGHKLHPLSGGLAAFSLLVLIVLNVVTLSPFRPTSQDIMVAEAGSNAIRQAALSVCLITSILSAVFNQGGSRRSILGLEFVVVILGWIVVSIAWSNVQEIAIRRAISLLFVTISAVLSARVLGYSAVLKIAKYALAAVLITDLASVWFIPAAVHSSGELDRQLVGDWRGMHTHKNRAGLVAVLGALVFLYDWLRTRSKFSLVLLFTAVVFLIGTDSRTAAGFGFIAAALMLYANSVFRSGLPHRSARLAAMVWVILGGAFAVILVAALASQNAATFTGRSAVWSVLVRYATSHPLTGAGYGSFWQVGVNSPALDFDHGWAGISAPHGHNGYLDALATLGVPGLLLVVVGLAIAPIARCFSLKHVPSELKSFALALYVLLALHNFLESSYITPNGEGWLFWSVLTGALSAVGFNHARRSTFDGEKSEGRGR